MGEVASLCEAAGLLSAFRAVVLKLGSTSGANDNGDVIGNRGDAIGNRGDVIGNRGEVRAELPPLPLPSVPVVVEKASVTKEEQREEAKVEMLSDSASEVEAVMELLVHIDHMNDAVGYTKLLGKWNTQLGLCGRLFYSMGGGRCVSIVVVLQGSPEATREFLQRLRTQSVDVDRSGRPCKERQATVLRQEPMQRNRPRLGSSTDDRWQCVEYTGRAELDAALTALGVTHATALLGPQPSPQPSSSRSKAQQSVHPNTHRGGKRVIHGNTSDVTREGAAAES